MMGVDIALIGLSITIAGIIFNAGRLSSRVEILERDVNKGFNKVATELEGLRKEFKEMDSKLDSCNIAIARNSN